MDVLMEKLNAIHFNKEEWSKNEISRYTDNQTNK